MNRRAPTRQQQKKENARHFTMKGRASEEAVDLSGGKTDGPLWRIAYIGLGSSERPTVITEVTPVTPAHTVVVCKGSNVTNT